MPVEQHLGVKTATANPTSGGQLSDSGEALKTVSLIGPIKLDAPAVGVRKDQWADFMWGLEGRIAG